SGPAAAFQVCAAPTTRLLAKVWRPALLLRIPPVRMVTGEPLLVKGPAELAKVMLATSQATSTTGVKRVLPEQLTRATPKCTGSSGDQLAAVLQLSSGPRPVQNTEGGEGMISPVLGMRTAPGPNPVKTTAFKKSEPGSEVMMILS